MRAAGVSGLFDDGQILYENIFAFVNNLKGKGQSCHPWVFRILSLIGWERAVQRERAH